VDRYLSASGFLGETARPFFVALPKGERGTHAMATETAEEFRHKIAATDKQVNCTSHDGDSVIRLDQKNAVTGHFLSERGLQRIGGWTSGRKSLHITADIVLRYQ
jgi:hypothetical protein